MKALLTSGLCLALGWAATRAEAQETSWRSAAPPGGVRTVSLRPPVSVGEAARGDALRPPLVRGQIPDERPLPPGPPALGLGGAAPPRTIYPGTATGQPLTAPAPFTPTMPQPYVPPPAGMPLTGTPLLGMPQTSGPLVESNRIWGSTLPSGVCDCGDGSGATCGVPGVCGAPGVCGVPGACGGATACGDGCGIGCNPWCNNRCNGGLFWVNAEYLLWFTRAQAAPALVTFSPLGTPVTQSGVLGAPGTTLADSHFNNNPVSGGRFGAGFWFPNCNSWGIDANYFFLGQQSGSQTFSGNGDPQISRPVTDALTGTPIAELVTFPGLVTGSVVVNDYSRLWGADTNLRKRICCGCNYWLDILGGYRYLNLTEGISVTENLNIVNPDGSFGGNIIVQDSFRTVNSFNGGQLGLQGQYHFGRRWFVGGSFKMAMGNVHETVDINGSTTFSGFTGPGVINGTRPGGLLALPTNIGEYTANHFAILPEVGIKVGVDLTQHLQAYVGYDFLYISNVVRPGDQIDTVINRSQLPNVTVPGTPPLVGPARPTVLFRTTDYWAQGMSFGLRYHW
jgi:hypothetical protein